MSLLMAAQGWRQADVDAGGPRRSKAKRENDNFFDVETRPLSYLAGGGMAIAWQKGRFRRQILPAIEPVPFQIKGLKGRAFPLPALPIWMTDDGFGDSHHHHEARFGVQPK